MKTNTIYTSSQYSDFVFKKENRAIDESFVEKLKASFEKYGWVGSPIEISESPDGKFQIEEGQHRFLAAKEMGMPIRFICVPQRSAYMQAEINDLTNKWKLIKFVEMYAKNGAVSYKRLLNLCEQFPQFSIRDILKASSVRAGKNADETVKKGRLNLSDENYIRGRNILLDMNEIIKAMDSINFKSRQYNSVFISLLKADAIDVERCVEKITKYGREIFEKVTTGNRAVDYIERVYNYNSKRDIVYLVDKYKRLKRDEG